jgi:hypothetical protein
MGRDRKTKRHLQRPELRWRGMEEAGTIIPCDCAQRDPVDPREGTRRGTAPRAGTRSVAASAATEGVSRATVRGCGTEGVHSLNRIAHWGQLQNGPRLHPMVLCDGCRARNCHLRLYRANECREGDLEHDTLEGAKGCHRLAEGGTWKVRFFLPGGHGRRLQTPLRLTDSARARAHYPKQTEAGAGF